jgi:protochlorophyllide reductase
MARSTVCKIMLHLVAATLLCVNGFQFEQFPMKHTIQTTRSVRLEAASLEHDEGNLFSNDDKKSSNGIDRRRALISTSVTALSLGLGNFGTAIRTWAQPNESPKTILVTGCNSGIGFEAARILARQGNTIIMACRTLEKASEAAEKIQAETVDAKLIPVECNLASQESIRNFANNLDQSLDIVCYNAGVALATDGKIERTEDGFELTVGTNHFGHFYLHNKIFPKIQKDSGRIVITASAVHDPDSPGGAQGKTATLGNLEGLIRDGKMFEMVDGQPYNGDKAYKDSKLCNIFFLRELQRQLAASEDTKGISVNAFSPGLITSTGLFRYQNPVFSSIFGVLATNIIKVAESPQWGGAALAYMTTVNTKGAYYNSAPGSSK